MAMPGGGAPARRAGMLAALAGCLAVLWAGPAWAHGMGWQAEDGFSVVVTFSYDDGEPMAYGLVKVFSPGDDAVQHQGGRSDRNGRFAFSPDAPGRWRFSGDDGQGHVTRGEIEVSAADLAGTAGPGGAARVAARGGAGRSGAGQVLLGLSVLANLALAGLWRQARRRARAGEGG